MNRFVRCSLSAAAGVALATWAGAAALAQNPASPSPQTQQSPAAQTQSPTTQTSTPQTQAPTTQSQATGTSEASPQQSQKKIEMVQAQAELNTSLDAKKAKQGEPIKAKLTENVQIPDGQPLPKNTVLEGHVDQVTASDHKKSDSTVVVTFDKAKLKDGQELPIKATVIAVSEPALAMQQGGGAPAGGGMPAASGGGMPSGGGMQGGGGGGSHASGGSSPAGGAAGPQQPTMPDASAATSQQQASAGIPDVKLTSDIHQQTSATFTSTGKNVHVPGGTQMQMAIAVIPAGVRIQ